jgi:hypothetical protein
MLSIILTVLIFLVNLQGANALIRHPKQLAETIRNLPNEGSRKAVF